MLAVTRHERRHVCVADEASMFAFLSCRWLRFRSVHCLHVLLYPDTSSGRVASNSGTLGTWRNRPRAMPRRARLAPSCPNSVEPLCLARHGDINNSVPEQRRKQQQRSWQRPAPPQLLTGCTSDITG